MIRRTEQGEQKDQGERKQRPERPERPERPDEGEQEPGGVGEPPLSILFASAEAWPLAKTGGLGDVAFGLTQALAAAGHDIRLLLPAYPSAVEALPKITARHRGNVDDRPVTLLEGVLPGTEGDTPVRTYLLDDPALFARVGTPYGTLAGETWPDNDRRFYWLSRVAAALAAGELLQWRAAVLHANDWQTALAPLFLRDHRQRPGTLFSIHNLAYRGLFGREIEQRLALPRDLWGPHGLEFYGQWAFIKGGLVLSDAITTVSPSYAAEIQTPAFGWGLDGLLRERAPVLHGIVNGIDTATWNPATDPHLAVRYDAPDAAAKAANRQAVANELGIDLGAGASRTTSPLLGFIGRLVEQKGVDLLLAALPRLLATGARLALLGSGDPALERALREAAAAHPGRIGLYLGYDEGLAHRIEAGADLFLMPSRFEPCGLNQLYSLRYGTPPVVNPTGGLADTVVDVVGWGPALEPGATFGAPLGSAAGAAAGTAPGTTGSTNPGGGELHPHGERAAGGAGDFGTGFHMASADAAGLAEAVERALTFWRHEPTWQAIQARGMAGDYSWSRSAAAYVALYRQVAA
ncbi:starch synthase [Halorhodospira abdelmalekii]|uniref:glycogen synthase GlgA n=1 Tax=Halorhodospira abdelmalekii TaxID=421629 RepID=UPI001F5BD2D2|nr:glycogen synthase GlgA [Halorhodospira abdelmalekii]MBK1734160.1 starch synthase [Halorhodospira abdelmalekii]